PVIAKSLLALIAGAAAVLAFAPFYYWPLLPLALAALFYLALQQSPVRAAGSGLLFGVGYFGAGVHWVYVSCYEFGQMGVLLSALATLMLVLYLAIYPALCCWLAARLWGPQQRARSPSPAVYLLGLPGLWIALELVRGGLFTGFPWIAIGYSQVDGPLAGVAPLIGATGVGWLIALLAGMILWLGQSRWRALPGVAVILLIMAMVGLRPVEWTRPSAEPLSLALVQGNVPQLTRWDPDQVRTNIGRHLQSSEPFWGVDLLVWPENAIPAFVETLPDGLMPALEQMAERQQTDLLVGMPLGDPVAGSYFNGIRLIQQGEAGAYRKRHLVPFGEYVPLRNLFGGLLDLLQVPMSAFSRGEAGQGPLALRFSQQLVAPSICYEILFPAEVLQMLPEAGILVNISNDAWFGDSIAPHQHLQIARMRAIESGRPLARATNSGITALVNWRGEVIAQAPQFTQTVLTGTLQPRQGSTPYVLVGDWPLRGILLFSLLFLYRQRRRSLASFPVNPTSS
ncbi:MAG: apolipoprotein N-acyltransferase, partial [Gammaproteobacteria bacterium]